MLSPSQPTPALPQHHCLFTTDHSVFQCPVDVEQSKDKKCSTCVAVSVTVVVVVRATVVVVAAVAGVVTGGGGDGHG